MPLVRDVAAEVAAGQSLCEWVAEPVLAGVRWGDNERRKAFVEVEEKLLPALVRGLVEGHCSVQGHCWYAITAAGVKFIESPFEASQDLPTQTDAARREYYYRIHVEIEALGSAKPDCDREIGEIPMPVSL